MKKFVPALAAGAIVAALALAPSAVASAAPAAHTAAKASSKHYTLTVDGNGKHATVVWMALTLKKGSAPTTLPAVHTIAKAHEPWRKHVKVGASLYEVAAVQTTGTKLSCTIKNTHGTVIARSTSRGKGTIVTCIVAKPGLLAGAGGGFGGSSIGSSLLPLR